MSLQTCYHCWRCDSENGTPCRYCVSVPCDRCGKTIPEHGYVHVDGEWHCLDGSGERYRSQMMENAKKNDWPDEIYLKFMTPDRLRQKRADEAESLRLEKEFATREQERDAERLARGQLSASGHEPGDGR